MYNLDINFLKDRLLTQELVKGTLTKRPQEPSRSKIPIFIGGGVGLGLIAISVAMLFLNNQQKGELTSEISKLDSQITELQAQNEQVRQLEEQVATARANRQALVSVFNQLKPVSAILQDISDQTPAGIQIESIKQTEEISEDPSRLPTLTLNITGFALSFKEVNDFLLILQQSDFLDSEKTYIQETQKIDNPNPVEFPDEQQPNNIEVSLPQVIQFTINTQVNEEPASNLIPQLVKTGASGLVTRIQTLKDKGAIEP